MISMVCFKKKKTLISFNYLYIQKNIFNIFAVSVVCGWFVRYDSVLSAISLSVEAGTALRAPTSF